MSNRRHLEDRTAPAAELTTATVTTRLEARGTGGASAREVEGIAVPWNEPTEAVGYRERFTRGAVDPAALVGLAVYLNHDRMGLPVGRIAAAEDRDAGAWVRVRLSDTTAGRDVHTLARDDVLNRFSISFIPLEDRLEDDGTLTRLRVEPKELSFAGFPAYAGAVVTQVRTAPPAPPAPPADTTTTTEKDNPMDPEQIDELRTANVDLERRIALLETGTPRTPAAPGVRFKSLGEVVKGLADRSVTRDDLAAVEALYTAAGEDRASLVDRLSTIGAAPAADAATRPAWIDRDIRIVDKGRPMVNLFRREPLPPEGMSITYPKLSSTTDNTGKQLAQGDPLGLVEIKVDTASAAVDTFGNYAELSRQAIERSSVAYLNRVLEAQKVYYGKATNKAIRDLLVGSAGTNTGLDISASNTTGKAWIDAALDAAGQIDANSTGLAADVWVMGLAHFKVLASIVDNAGRPVFAINGDGSNTFGSVNLLGFRANVGGLPVLVDPSLTGVTSYVCSAEAITTLESPGAPFTLTDDNIVSLTRAFSLYGYLAATLDDAKGIVKVKTSV